MMNASERQCVVLPTILSTRDCTRGCVEAMHCKSCGCVPLFDTCRIVGRNRNRLTREIIVVEEIEKMGDMCVNMPSSALRRKNLIFLVCQPCSCVIFDSYCLGFRRTDVVRLCDV